MVIVFGCEQLGCKVGNETIPAHLFSRSVPTPASPVTTPVSFLLWPVRFDFPVGLKIIVGIASLKTRQFRFLSGYQSRPEFCVTKVVFFVVMSPSYRVVVV